MGTKSQDLAESSRKFPTCLLPACRSRARLSFFYFQPCLFFFSLPSIFLKLSPSLSPRLSLSLFSFFFHGGTTRGGGAVVDVAHDEDDEERQTLPQGPSSAPAPPDPSQLTHTSHRTLLIFLPRLSYLCSCRRTGSSSATSLIPS